MEVPDVDAVSSAVAAIGEDTLVRFFCANQIFVASFSASTHNCLASAVSQASVYRAALM